MPHTRASVQAIQGAPGSWFSRPSPTGGAGFTLFELLISMVIISIVLSLAVLALPPSKPPRKALLEEEASRLVALLRLAREEAMLKGGFLGFSAREDGYEFFVLEQGEWKPADSDDALRPRTLATDLTLEMKLAQASPSEPASDAKRATLPQVVLRPSGEMNDFSITLHALGIRGELRIEGTPVGKLTLVAAD